MSLAFGRYSARSGLRARGGSECGSKPGQPCTHGINLGVKKRTSLDLFTKKYAHRTFIQRNLLDRAAATVARQSLDFQCY